MRELTNFEARKVSGGKGGGGGSSTTMPTIPNELKPLANRYAGLAIDYSNKPFQGFEGQRFADLNPYQNQALDMVQQRATQGSQTVSNAEGALNQFIQGGQTNPYLDQMVQKAQGSVADQWNLMTKPQMESAMVRSGSFGNEGLMRMQQQQQKAAAQQMSDIATSMYGNAYETDKGRQMQAVGMAPTFGQQAYQDAGQLLNAGNIQQNQQQQGLDFAFDQFQAQQDYPIKQLQAMSGVLGQNTGSTTTQKGGGGK